jgi:transposase-like protein
LSSPWREVKELKELGMSKLQTRSILVVVLVLASLGLLGLNQAGSLGPLKGALLVPLTALQKWVAQTWNGAEATFQRSPDVEALRQRNAELEAENARLKAQTAAAAEDRATEPLPIARLRPPNREQIPRREHHGLDPCRFSLHHLSRPNAGVTSRMPVVTDQTGEERVEGTATSAKCSSSWTCSA